ncbi:conserved oligomeric Golgi complex subunit 4 [Brevipalpus obovatus]|uniref:conserved oligomeric Golgi complex subunit 4 n=1 Tax=Brevipalpus obovatus TaxID=246614 RepID=UPI003D9FA874
MSTYQELVDMHEKLCSEDKLLRSDIENALNRESRSSDDMRSLWSSMPNLSQMSKDVKHILEVINSTSKSTSEICDQVKQLDLIKNRISQCLQRVVDILDLKYCTQNVEEAMNSEDYEVAAANIHRFLSIDESLVRNSANNTINGQVFGETSMDKAFSKLREAEEKLKSIVMRKFDEAVSEDDFGTVQRFFKIFPLLNQREEGMRKFSNYMSNKMGSLSNSSGDTSKEPDTHIGQLTDLFESVAKLVDENAPLLETYYGPGNLISCLEVLQRECDRRTKKIMDDFVKKRSIAAVMNTIQKLNKASSSNNVIKVDPREIDSLLNEMALVTSRTEIYLRFIIERAKKDFQPVVNDLEDQSSSESKHQQRIVDLARSCQLSRMLQEINGTYVLLEEYFIRESCARAIQMDDVDRNALTSNMLDDVFYIVKKSINRALSSENLEVLCAVINHSVNFLDTAFYNALCDRTKYGFPSGISNAAAALDLSQAYNAIQTGRYLQTTSDIEKAKLLFLTALNNLDSAADYIGTLRNNILEQVVRSPALVEKPKNREKLESCLADLLSCNDKFQSLIHSGLNHMFTGLLKPWIKSWLSAFNSESHLLTDDDIARNEATDGLRAFTQNFIVNLDNTLRGIKNGLTSNNYRDLLIILAGELTKRLESVLSKCTFNELGGFQLDREARAIINYITSSTNSPIRDKFTRLKQISEILSSPSIEDAINCVQSSKENSLHLRSATYLCLSPSEIHQFLKLRSDFSYEDLRKVKI